MTQVALRQFGPYHFGESMNEEQPEWLTDGRYRWANSDIDGSAEGPDDEGLEPDDEPPEFWYKKGLA